VCEYCSKAFFLPKPFAVKRGAGRYCSGKCQRANETMWITIAQSKGLVPKNPGKGVTNYITILRKHGLLTGGE
jgi:hypothetical protein